MKKEESDLKIMEAMERRELQDWAILRLLRQKAIFGVVVGFLCVLIGEDV